MAKSKKKKEPTWDQIGEAIGNKIEKECEVKDKNWFSRGCSQASGCGGAIYGLGFLGALFYFITTATSITAGIIGVIKAIFWPGVIVYGLLKFLGM
ncbi:MAG TPA: hypothetical protein PKK60_00065 [archaeon]|nr:hypothetical protein [archaeon]